MKDNDSLPSKKKITLTPKHLARMRLGRFAKYNLHEIEGDHVPRLQKYVKNIRKVLEGGYGMYLWGSTGSGKSTCAAAVVKELGKRGYSCAVVSATELAGFLAPQGDQQFDEQESILERLRSVHVLVINDLGAEYHSQTSTWLPTQLNALLNDRRNSTYSSTIFTSNYSPVPKRTKGESALSKRYTHALASLISEMSLPIQVIGGVNFRNKRRDEMEALLS